MPRSEPDAPSTVPPSHDGDADAAASLSSPRNSASKKHHYRHTTSNKPAVFPLVTTKRRKKKPRHRSVSASRAKSSKSSKSNNSLHSNRSVHSHRSASSSEGEGDGDEDGRARSDRSVSDGGDPASSAPSATASLPATRSSLPYPAFSKAHSREATHSSENVRNRLSALTPDLTDSVDDAERRRRKKKEHREHKERDRDGADRPPSPPLTSDGNPVPNRSASSVSTERKDKDREPSSRAAIAEAAERRMRDRRERHAERAERHAERKGSGMPSSSSSSRPPGGSRSGSYRHSRLSVEGDGDDGPTRTSSKHRHSHHSSSTPIKDKIRDSLQLGSSRQSNGRHSSHSHRSRSTREERSRRTPNHSTVESEATSIAPNQQQYYYARPGQTASASAGRAHRTDDAPANIPESPVMMANHDTAAQYGSDSVSGRQSLPPPPPPPPPPMAPTMIPRVDYLLRNGGLGCPVPKTLLGAGQSNILPQQLFDPHRIPIRVFEPYAALLDDYNTVLSKGGSIAVATGYRSVARRLLDRLESVFARDISSEECQCVMCRSGRRETIGAVQEEEFSWGEVLELVCGRRELPAWPPFRPGVDRSNAATAAAGLGVVDEEPMQRLDIDIPESWRDHYLRESQKKKSAVDRWLSRRSEPATGGEEGPGGLGELSPDEVDDETLMFAMMTYLDPGERRTFAALLDISTGPPVPRRMADTPAPSKTEPQPPQQKPAEVCPPWLEPARVALQRLYRLSVPARACETAYYMLKNPSMHDALATLAAISGAEWDILVSGRFDGFLRSGAEDDDYFAFQPVQAQYPYTSMTAPPDRVSSRQPSSASLAASAKAGSMGGRHSAASMRPATSASMGDSAGAATPAPAPGPISIDEETEISALAEIERDVYAGMEVLEDAFEQLHVKAETVRRRLRERSFGLTYASQVRHQRRFGVPAIPGVVPGLTPGMSAGMGSAPASASVSAANLANTYGAGPFSPAGTPMMMMMPGLDPDGWGPGLGIDTEEGVFSFPDNVSELAPSDSASNVASSRRRRPRRRSERRRTPAIVEEEGEGR